MLLLIDLHDRPPGPSSAHLAIMSPNPLQLGNTPGNGPDDPR